MSYLYIVGTPIGNLGDITLRAISALKEADIVLCEDTRVTKKLLNHFDIKDKQLSTYNEQKSGASIDKIIAWLSDGKNIALVTDAGTPGVSDPGGILVREIMEKMEGKVKVESVPGVSALTTAISISGVDLHEFVFLGFLPHKKGRETLFKEIANTKRPVVFYESPHRIIKSLESLDKFCPDKQITVARELTKIFEEVLRGTPKSVKEKLTKEKQKGEFVVIVS
jgi:16S rRNA (cytidine1402-2'-O)-methyltransferase